MDGWVAAVQVVPKAFDHPSSASTAAIYACVRAGLKEAQRVVTDALEALIRGRVRPSANSAVSVGAISVGDAAGTGEAELRRRLQQPNPVDEPNPLEACNWLNITACNTTGRQTRIIWK